MEPLGLGDCDPVIATCKRKLGVVPADECVTDLLVQRVRGVQLLNGLEVSGLIDEDVLSLLGVEFDGEVG